MVYPVSVDFLIRKNTPKVADEVAFLIWIDTEVLIIHIGIRLIGITRIVVLFG